MTRSPACFIENVPPHKINAFEKLNRKQNVIVMQTRYARIKTVNTISVGCAWDHGNHTDHRGTIAIDTMRTKRKLLVMLRKNYDLRLPGE